MSVSPLNFISSAPRIFLSRILILCGFALMGWMIFQTEFSGQSTGEIGTLFILDTSLSMSVEDIAGDTGVMRSRLDIAKDLI